MGKQKHQPRADRRRRGTSGGEPRAAGRLSERDVERMVAVASGAFRANDLELFEEVIRLLDEGCTDDPALVDRSVTASLGLAIRAAWQNGWQPADVVRATARALDRTTAALSADVIAADAAAYEPRAMHPHWREQLSDLGANVWWTADASLVAQWERRHSLSRADMLRTAVELLSFLHHLPTLPLLCPPPREPGTQDTGGDRSWAMPTSASSSELERIRALLSKAESTTFPEEAEALSAKAQELMATHSIDRIASVADHHDHRPIGRRIGIDNPYASAKSLLLDRVASANRCRSVWTPAVFFSTVFGDEGDVDSVDMLFTSLLTQAAAALRVADRRRVADGGGRARSFRQAFHVGYALRIGSRLADVVAAAETAAETALGRTLLPVLANHAADVDAAVDAAFPGLVHRSVSVTNRAGWASGVAAAEVASLTIHREVDGGQDSSD